MATTKSILDAIREMTKQASSRTGSTSGSGLASTGTVSIDGWNMPGITDYERRVGAPMASPLGTASTTSTTSGGGSGSGSGGTSGGGGGSGGTASTTSTGGGSAGGAQRVSQEGKPYGCPDGAFLTFEANGSGNHVCQWEATGGQFAVQPKSTTDSSSGGSDGGGSGSGSGAGDEYLEGPGADIFAQNPTAMAADILNRTYGDSNTGLGLLQQLGPYGDAANVLFLAERGQDAEGGTKAQFLDWLGDYWNTLMTPGASIGDPQALWENITNPAQNSPLVSYLAVQDPEQQARNFRSLAAGIMGTYYHPLVADAVMDNLAYRQDAFLGEAARGAEAPFYEWYMQDAPFFERMY